MKFHFKILLLVCAISGFAAADDVSLTNGSTTQILPDQTAVQTDQYGQRVYKNMRGGGYTPASDAQVQQSQALSQDAAKSIQAKRLGTDVMQRMNAFESDVRNQKSAIEAAMGTTTKVAPRDEYRNEQNILDAEKKMQDQLKQMSPQDLAAYFKDPARNPTLNDAIENTLGLERRWRTQWFGTTVPTTEGVESASLHFEEYLNSLKKAYQTVDDQHLSTLSDAISPKPAAAASSTTVTPTVTATKAAPVVRAAAAPVRKASAVVSSSQTNASNSQSSGTTSTNSSNSATSNASTTPVSSAAAAPVAPATPAATTSTTRNMRGDGNVPVGSAADFKAPPPQPAPAPAKEDPSKCLGLQFTDDAQKKAGLDDKKAAKLKENECVPGSYSVAPCKKRYGYDPEIDGKQCLEVCRHYIFSSSYTQDIYNSDIATMLDSPDTKDAAKMLLNIEGIDEAELRAQMKAANAPSDQGRVPYRNSTRPVISDSADKLQELAVALNKALPQDKSNGNYCEQISKQSKTVIAQAEKGKDSAILTTTALKNAVPSNYSLQNQCSNPNGDVAALKIKHFFSSDETMVVQSVVDVPGTSKVRMTYDYWDPTTKTWQENVMQLRASTDSNGLVDEQGNHLDLHQVSANSLPNKSYCTTTPAPADASGRGTASNGSSDGGSGPGVK